MIKWNEVSEDVMKWIYGGIEDSNFIQQCINEINTSDTNTNYNIAISCKYPVSGNSKIIAPGFGKHLQTKLKQQNKLTKYHLFIKDQGSHAFATAAVTLTICLNPTLESREKIELKDSNVYCSLN